MEKKMFWGIIFIAIGLMLILNYVFGINIPVFRTLVAVGFIFLGVKILTGSMGWGFRGYKSQTPTEAMFSRTSFEWNAAGKKKYQKFSSVFGAGELDLRNIDLTEETYPRIKVDVVFGETKILVPEDLPLIVKAQTVFGSANLPDQNSSAFGNLTYRSPAFDANGQFLEIEADIVFGTLEIRNLPKPAQ